MSHHDAAFLPHRSRLDVALAFGRALKHARWRAGLSQLKLAERADIDITYPSLLERGLRLTTIGTLLALADALGVPAVALLAEAERHLGRVPPPPF